MADRRVLIANRGEVAVRVARAVGDLGWTSIGVHGADEPTGPHLRHCDERVELSGAGVAPYLDVEQLVEVAHRADADLLHPGYGFLAESPDLAEACGRSGVGFVGPDPSVLRTLGDKPSARSTAARLGIPVLPATTITDAASVEAFLAEIATTAIIKASAGGGGRGMAVVTGADDIAAAIERCRSEAAAAFGRGDLYAEELVRGARHIEVQLVGDGLHVVSLGERECTLQRRHQKLVESAPSPGLPSSVRQRLETHALTLGESLAFRGLVTVEFLLDAGDRSSGWFIEANPRLQVEHTVTEAVLGLDLVRLQLLVADGRSLDEVGLGTGVPEPRGVAIEARVSTERIEPDASVRPTGGRIAGLVLPTGPGIRCDTAAHAGMATNPSFDAMLVKIVAHGGDHDTARRRLVAALDELKVDGLETNAPFLRALMSDPDVSADRITTTFVGERAADLIAASAQDDGAAGRRTSQMAGPDGTEPVAAPLQGTVVAIAVAVGEAVVPGSELLVMEAMKMEHVIEAPGGGIVRSIEVAVGDAVLEGSVLVYVEPGALDGTPPAVDIEVDINGIRPDLQAVMDRHAVGLDEHRPDKVARRHAGGSRTARENLADLVDDGSFVEYGPLVVAAQRRRRSMEDLVENTPADGLVGGIASINGDLFPGHSTQAVVMSYDYMVLAGTQGLQNHRKKDRLFEIAKRQRLPVVLFTEGGGGRPGDTDTAGGSGLDCLAFLYFAGLSGRVPLVGINNGPCFAGNAALLGCCDVIIATASSSIGMGGPAMIEGGGLGAYDPSEVGPLGVQVPNGVVDIAVADEAEAVAVAKRYLSYFQGPLEGWDCPDQRLLRHVIPENRLRIYDVRRVIDTMFDTGSVLELRSGWGPGMVTALARVEGRPLGVIANNPAHLAGAIDSDAADKASRFMQLCDAHDLPIVMLCDTPGIMVGPEAEKQATVRHAARMFVTGASADVPMITIVLRKGYGLGAQAMAGGSFRAGLFTVSWPTGEFGGMGLEGFVKLGYRRELEAIDDPEERQRRFEEMVANLYESGRALNNATTFEIDDVIDPVDSRRWIVTALRSAPPDPPRSAGGGKKRPMIDTW